MRNWMADLKGLTPSNIDVQHEPMTDRYFRAVDKRQILVRWGEFLGVRKTASSNFWEVAIWLENQSNSKKPGIYSCFRLLYSAKMEPLSAILFCFYDGTEKSLAFRNKEAALSYAEKEDFHA